MDTNLKEDKLLAQIVDEWTTAGANRQIDDEDFESYVDLLDSVRQEKEYDWNSDIRIPEFVSHVLTQSADDVGQYFQTRDFTEVYVNDKSDEAKKAADSCEELVNRTLNQRKLYHFPKFIRARTINNLVGKVYAKCRWLKTYQTVGVEETILVPTGQDVNGLELVDPRQVPAVQQETRMRQEQRVVVDRFDYQIYDQRNVRTSNVYTYSIQEKPWVIFNDEMTLSELKAMADGAGYFNLDKLENMAPPDVTEKKESTTENPDNSPDTAIEKDYDILERYGKFWTVADRGPGGDLIYGSEKIGLDVSGKPLENAEMLDVIITIARSGGQQVLIGFRLTPFVSATGDPYIPAIRGICYFHPTEDGGMGDGKHVRELQIAIDDTFNLSQDRTMLATMPVFKSRKQSIEDNDEVYIKPGHNIPLNDPNDMVELVIKDNITAALQQMSVLESKMRQVDSVQPPSMGQTPADASTTATAVATASQGQSKRNQYKSLAFEYTFLTELYWMINQMTYVFAEEETLFKLMGDKVYDFDPSLDYYYTPLSQSIETDQSKIVKRTALTTILGFAIQLQHPDAVKIVNYLFGELVKLMGDEYENFMANALDENVPITPQGVSAQPAAGYGGPVNQTGIMPGSEQMATQYSANQMGA